MNDTPSANTPYPKALLLCDAIIVDEISKKKTLVGVFSQINIESFPAHFYPMTLYARLIDAEGVYDFILQYVQVSNDKLLNKADIPNVTIPDRLAIHEIVIKLPILPIPDPGQYEFRIWANNKYVGSTSFKAVQIKP